MPISAPFNSVGEADQAYYSTEGTDEGTTAEESSPDTEATWGSLQEHSRLDNGWVLAYQEQQNGDRQRWFVIRTAEGQLQAIRSSGEVYTASASDSLSELPHYPTEDDAREAFSKWDAPESDQAQPSEEWEEWRRLRQIDPWWVFSRSHRTEERVQFLVAGKRSDGSTVYLGPGGQLRDDPHIFQTFEQAQAAIRSYLEAVQDGRVPEADQPTGDAPSRTEIREAVRTSSQSTQHVERMVEKLAGEKALMVAGGAAAIYLIVQHREGASL